jgi:hypothetical protein
MTRIDSFDMHPAVYGATRQPVLSGSVPPSSMKWFLDRRMPHPKRIDDRVIWDRLKIEAAFSDLPEDNRANPLDRIFGDH